MLIPSPGISQPEYRAAVRASANIVWFCTSYRPNCPIAESTREEFNVSTTVDSFPQSENTGEGRENFNVNVDTTMNPFSESSMAILESEEFNPPVYASSEESTFHSPELSAIEESSIYESVPCPEAEPSNTALTFSIMEGATNRGKRKLIDSYGYSYNVKRQRVKATDWQCTVRPLVRNKEEFLFIACVSVFLSANQSTFFSRETVAWPPLFNDRTVI